MTAARLEDAIKQLFVKNNDDASTSTAAVGYDCVFIVGPSRISIGCHRAIVQARSTAMKDVIISESNNADDEDGSILEINLPDDAEAIRALVQYCYTNTIPTKSISSLEAVDNLLLATKKFGLDEVAELCKKLIAALEHQSSLPASMEGKILAVPNSHLDLTCLIDDKVFSDMIIKTEDEDIHAHKCVLLSRVPSLASEIQLNADVSKDVVDISNIPRISVNRVMLFLYGDKVAATNHEEVLQDIITAKELNVNELVSKLERIALAHITDDNALDVLKFSMHNGLEDLKNAALDSLANCDYDGLFESIKRLENSCSSITIEFENAVRTAEQSRTKQTPQLIQGISLRGCMGLVAASLVSLLLLQNDNEFLVAFTNVCFCLTVGFFFL